jgi:hypothetical protein
MQRTRLGLTIALMVIATGSSRLGMAHPAPEAPAAPAAGGHPVPGAPRCPIFPADNVWNRAISHLPVAPSSAHMIAAIGTDRGLHPDFGADARNGIPFNVVGRGRPLVRVTFDYADESDSGPFPIPAHPLIEAGSDHHLLIVDRDRCRLYELYAAEHTAAGWHAGSGAFWDLRANRLRPDSWTSADAAGLPILPGLVRYGEVAAGVINHALRFTAPRTARRHIYPARHDASSRDDPALPPMGLRVRLKASVDISHFGPQARVILAALKKYGMILADNGSPWFITGVPDPRWNDDALHIINRINGSDFEVVDTSHLRNGP